MARILSIGTDPFLLQTRAEVLKKTGAEVLTRAGSDEMFLGECPACDLAVMCHSMTGGRALQAVDAIRKRWPGCRILLLEPSDRGRPTLLAADAVLEYWRGPAALIEVASCLLTHRRPAASVSLKHSGDVPSASS